MGIRNTAFGKDGWSNKKRLTLLGVFLFSALLLTLMLAAIASGNGGWGEAHLVSEGVDGYQSDFESLLPDITPDGRYVVFVSYGNLLCSIFSGMCQVDANGSAPDIYLKDRQTGSIERISTNAAGEQANGSSSDPVISADGRYVAFVSVADNLTAPTPDTNQSQDVFVKDRQTGSVKVASRARISISNGNSHLPSISADGRYVAFSTGADNLAPNDNNQSSDIFVKDMLTGDLIYATHSDHDNNCERFHCDSNSPSISADGRYVAFESLNWHLLFENMPANPNYELEQIYRKDLQSGVIELVSSGSSGPGDGVVTQYPSISADGRYIAFSSDGSTNLVPEQNAYADIFLKDMTTGAIKTVTDYQYDPDELNCRYPSACYQQPDISPDGRFVTYEAYFEVLSDDGLGGYLRVPDVYVSDTALDTVELVSKGYGGTTADGISQHPAISSNGRSIAFQSEADNLIADDDNGAVRDIFVVNSTLTYVNNRPGLRLRQTNAYWASSGDYENKLLSVDFELTNDATSYQNAYDVTVLGARTTNGVMQPIYTPDNPLANPVLGTIAIGSQTSFTRQYIVPEGVTAFRTTVYVSAANGYGDEYYYPRAIEQP